VLLLLLGGVAGLVLIPPLLPKDPREVVLRQYLAAVRKGDLETAGRLGVLENPPVVEKVNAAQWVEGAETETAGAFQPIAEMHAHLRENYQRVGEVFQKKDSTGTLAKLVNVLDDVQRNAGQASSLEDASALMTQLQQSLEGQLPPEAQQAVAALKAQMEQGKAAKSGPAGTGDSAANAASPATRKSQKPRDDLDRAVEFAENYAAVAQSLSKVLMGGPKNQALTATYDQLVKEWSDKFDPAQVRLLQSVCKEREKWRKALGGRDFSDINEPGSFKLLESTWEADVWLPGQSSGEPPRKVLVKLVRFQLGLIDSGWKVWEIQAR
jgi:hypothetical protein